MNMTIHDAIAIADQCWTIMIKNVDIYKVLESQFWIEWSQLSPHALCMNQKTTPHFKIKFLPNLLKNCFLICKFPDNVSELREIHIFHRVWLVSEESIILLKKAFFIALNKAVKSDQISQIESALIMVFDESLPKIIRPLSPKTEFYEMFHFSGGKWKKEQIRFLISGICIHKSGNLMTKSKEFRFSGKWTVEDVVTNPQVPDQPFSFCLEDEKGIGVIYLAAYSEKDKQVWVEKLMLRIQALEIIEQINQYNQDVKNK